MRNNWVNDGAHSGKGRYLQPTYFNKELYLHFNLGPLHLLTELCQDIVKDCERVHSQI